MKALLISLSLLFYAAISSTASACSCAYGGYWVSDFVKDKVVFEGRAISSQWLGNDSWRQIVDHTAETNFRVLQPYHNVSTHKITIGHDTYGASCGLIFGMGHERLVITYNNKKDALRTNSCSANAVNEITLIKYFEQNIDTYIPSPSECTDEQITNPEDSKNCYYLSSQAAETRQEEMSERRYAKWKSKREEKNALTPKDETP